MTTLITHDTVAHKLSWPGAVAALRAGHLRPRAETKDLFLGPGTRTLLNRAAYIEGLGYGVKAVSVFDENAARGKPTVQGAMTVFDPNDGAVTAVIDATLVTEFKTAADSVLGASLLARPNSRHLLVVGAGVVAASLVQAYSALFPDLDRISIWARRPEQAEALISRLHGVKPALHAVTDLAGAAATADIITSATMARAPILMGSWLRPGTHVDLIGAYKPDMREADDALISQNALFVDSRDTTIHHIGELMIPIAAGVITEDDIRGDLYDLLSAPGPRRRSDDEITVFKNGGGAHLDLMIAAYIAQAIERG
jgi:ornithine cyclodeaminase